MFNPELINFIKNDYEEIKDLTIKLDGDELDDNNLLYNLLTPYLAHKNNLDGENRIISFFTKEGSKQQKLFPFYIALSNYVKASKSKDPNFEIEKNKLYNRINDVFNLLPKSFLWLDKEWSIIKLKALSSSRKIAIDIQSIEKFPNQRSPELINIVNQFEKFPNYRELRSIMNIAQDELDNLANNYQEEVLIEKIKRVNQTDKLGTQQIFELGASLNVKPASGVLLFTNKLKYKSLIKNTEFNDIPISEIIPIAEIKQKRDTGELYYDEIEKDPYVFFINQDYLGGWKEIIEILKVDYIDTIIVDDFGDVMQKDEIKDYEQIRLFSESLKGGGVDVYLLDNDSNFDNIDILEKFKLYPWPWLINYQERNYLIKQENYDKVSHKVYPIKDNIGSSFWNMFKPISNHLKNIAIEINTPNKLKAEIWSTIQTGFEINSRSTSFYSINLKNEIDDFILSLETINIDVDQASLRDKIKFLKEAVSSIDFENRKLLKINDLIKKYNLSGPIVIVSNNKNSNDRNEAKRIINKSFPEIEIIFTTNDNFKLDYSKDQKTAFFLNFLGKLSKTLFLHKFYKNQYLILNNTSELGSYKKCFNKFTPLIKNYSDFTNKLLILKLEAKDKLIEETLIDYNTDDYIEYEVELDESNEELIDDINEQDFSFMIKEITKELNKKQGDILTNSTSYLVFFKNSIKTVNESKIYHVLDDFESKSSSNITKKAIDLEPGDKVFFMEGFNDDFMSLLKKLRKENNKLNEYIDFAESWRTDLKDKYLEYGEEYKLLNKHFLEKKGINVVDQTVGNWVSGYTIQPKELDKIIDILHDIPESNTSKYNPQKIKECTNWLKNFRMELHKDIFKYQVFKRHEMYEQISKLKYSRLVKKIDKDIIVDEVLMIQKN
jgi:hypothetical protein